MKLPIQACRYGRCTPFKGGWHLTWKLRARAAEKGVTFVERVCVTDLVQQAAVVVYSPQFAKNKDLGNRFAVAYVQAVREYYTALWGGGSRKELVDLLVETTRIKDRKVWETMEPNGIDPDGYVNVESLKKDYNFLKEIGQLTININFDEVVDLSYVDYAMSPLKKGIN